MKTIIAGSRYIESMNALLIALEYCGFQGQIEEVVCGEAGGMDRVGRRWAEVNHIPIKSFPVEDTDWQRFGRYAGLRRNRLMAEYADSLILVWDGESKGSKDMLNQASRHGLKIYQLILQMRWEEPIRR